MLENRCRFGPREAFILMNEYISRQSPKKQAEIERHKEQIEEIVEIYRRLFPALPVSQKGVVMTFISSFERVEEILNREKETPRPINYISLYC